MKMRENLTEKIHFIQFNNIMTLQAYIMLSRIYLTHTSFSRVFHLSEKLNNKLNKLTITLLTELPHHHN